MTRSSAGLPRFPLNRVSPCSSLLFRTYYSAASESQNLAKSVVMSLLVSCAEDNEVDELVSATCGRIRSPEASAVATLRLLRWLRSGNCPES